MEGRSSNSNDVENGRTSKLEVSRDTENSKIPSSNYHGLGDSASIGIHLGSLHDTRYRPENNTRDFPASPTELASTDKFRLSSNASILSSESAPSALYSSSSAAAMSGLMHQYGSIGDQMRQRIPSIHSPSSGMPLPVPSLTSNHKSVSPSLPSSVRSDYSTSTPHLGRHHHLPSRASLDILSQGQSHHRVPASPSNPLSPSISDSTISSEAGANSMAVDSNSSQMSQQGPSLQETEVIHQIVSSEGHYVRPEIHARVDKGFFLSDDNWTCYRRNYFSVVCSYSLSPTQFTLPLYLRHGPGNGQTSSISSFAVKISAAVDGPNGKAVELVQHTPKRDKGPQLEPTLMRLIPQPVGGAIHPPHSQQSRLQGVDYDSFAYAQAQYQQSQQQQSIANYDRIQFKSATANNGKRRAAQQYYHLIIELHVCITPSSPSGESRAEDWIKVAHRVSAPMVVRGRSPGHYVEDKKSRHPSTERAGSSHSMHAPNTYSTSSMLNGGHHYYHKPSLSSSASDHHDHLIMPSLSESEHSALNPELSYAYFPAPLQGLDMSSHNTHPFNGYFSHSSMANDRRLQQPLEVNCSHYGNEIGGYLPSSGSSRSRGIKQEDNYSANWMQTPRDEQRLDHLPKYDRLFSADTSASYYPPLPAL